MFRRFRNLFIIAFACGCTNDVDIEMPGFLEMPVVNCLFAADSTWKMDLSLVNAVESNEKPATFNNADISISDGTNTYQLYEFQPGDYRNDSIKVKENCFYNLTISIPGYKTLFASDIVPEREFPVVGKLDSLAYYISPNTLFFGQFRAFKVPVNIPGSLLDSKLIFRAFALRKGTYFESDSATTYEYLEIPVFERVDIFSIDPYYRNIGQDSRSVLGPMVPFNSDTYQLNIWIPQEEFQTGYHSGKLGYQYYDAEYYIDIIVASADFFNYMETYITHMSYKISPFAEPTRVFSNVENGVGIFAGYVSQRIRVDE